MDDMTSWLADNLDFLIFVLVGLALFGVLETWLRRRAPHGRLPWIVWPTVVILWVLGWFLVDAAGRSESARIRDFLQGVAPTYAQSVQRAGHTELTFATAEDDPVYLNLIDAMNRWKAVNPVVSDIYTFRRDGGRVRLVVASETDYNRNGTIDGEREQRVKIGREYAHADKNMLRALDGEQTFSEVPVRDEWGVWVSAQVPLKDEQGRVEGALGVDYPAEQFLAAVAMGRERMIWLLSVPLLILGFTTATMGALRAEIAARREVEVRLRGLNVDLQSRVNSEETQRLIERRLALHVRNTPLAVIEWDMEFRVTAWNPAAERIFGFTVNDVMGKIVTDMIVPKSARPQVDVVWQQVMNCRGGERSFNHNLTKDGRVILCDWYNSPLIDEAGRVIGVASHCEDITHRETMEIHLRQTQKIESLGHLAAGVAHEFNNLLTPMLLRLEMLRADRAADADLLMTLRSIEDAIYQAAQLNQRILAVGRRSAEKRELLALNPVVDDTVSLLRHTLDRSITLEMNLEPGLGPLLIDRAQVAQVVVNLMLNARDALTECSQARRGETWTPRINVVTERVETILPLKPGESGCGQKRACQRISVSDNGSGITDEVRTHIFEPFYTTKAPGQGTGLGLAVVWNIVKNLDGWITAENAIGGGAVFNVYLPVPDSPAVADPMGPVDAIKTPAVNRLRILLVDDNIFVADTLNKLLAREGHVVTYAANGEEALSLLAKQGETFELLITDQNMPGITGIELTRTLRAGGQSLPVIVVSGHISAVLMEELDRLQVSSVLDKPFTQKQLLAAVAAVARG